MATSPIPLLSMLGLRLTKPPENASEQVFRFNETSFRALLARFPECETFVFEPGGRELVAVCGSGAKQ